MDAHRRSACRVRAPISGFRPRLADPRIDVSSRHLVRHHPPCCRLPSTWCRTGTGRSTAIRVRGDRIPRSTALLIQCASERRARGGNRHDGGSGRQSTRQCGTATFTRGRDRNQKIVFSSRLRIVDAILSGTHEPGTSHYELLRAFASEATLRRMDEQLGAGAYRTHEFGDSVFVETSLRLAGLQRDHRNAEDQFVG